ncbi:hypothetical protein CANARDRAFT_68744 [[Candida] arabinofermentans NRRL YB-2248]|uniref:Mitochondrial adapter protein MCP1 transmembrane domain-containing protein n=1 Tax=[Candida] arabinofermentans NRRL YB-2248 TaxID=983967 RepID=A0A1E4SXG4_9ASCO|nr:hypothetical protein CANARDRAFT_68744 [[Candida] arabinofermentans NRRL YB-2248]
MTSLLKSVSPEPITLEEITSKGLPKPATSKLIPFLTAVQKYSTIPFSIFSFLHLSSVVVAPSLSLIEIGEQLMSMGREIYQVSGFEKILLWSSIAHVLSGMSLRGIRLYDNYNKYGKVKVKKRRGSRSWKAGQENKETVTDKDEGLGGILSILGLGSRKSLSARFLGLSPSSFSGYLLVPMLIYHVIKERIGPWLVDGDSSFIDLSYISHAIFKNPLKTPVGLVVMVAVASYHMLSGFNRFMKLFSLRARKLTYAAIATTTFLASLSVFFISKMGPAFGATARRFDAYDKAVI